MDERIQAFPYSRLTNANASQTYDRMKNHYLENTAVEELKPFVDKFVYASDNLRYSIRQATASVITRTLALQEPERDRITNLLKNSVRTGLRSTDPKIVEAANVVDVILRLYGNLTHRQQDEQTRQTEKAIRDLKAPEVRLMVSRIPGCESALAAMAHINQEFSENFNARIVERGKIVIGQTADLRKEADIEAQTVSDAFNAYAMLHVDDTIRGIINNVNAVLDQARIDLENRRRGRRVRNANAAERENEQHEGDSEHEEHNEDSED